MATHLDFEEQEQLDQLKEFWARYGNLVTTVVVLCLGAFVAWNGWQWWQRDQAAKAAALFHEMEVADQANDAKKATQVLGDMLQRYPSTTYAAQAALLAAKVQANNQQTDAARSSLQWVQDHASDRAYVGLARLRLAGLLIDANKLDEALQQLSTPLPEALQPLADDRRGDILQLQHKSDLAIAAYQAAWTAMKPELDYRRLVEAKLMALGAAPMAASAPASEAQP